MSRSAGRSRLALLTALAMRTSWTKLTSLAAVAAVALRADCAVRTGQSRFAARASNAVGTRRTSRPNVAALSRLAGWPALAGDAGRPLRAVATISASQGASLDRRVDPADPSCQPRQRNSDALDQGLLWFGRALAPW
jgi:hypothetical protein